MTAPTCQNGGCPSERVALYLIPGLPDRRALCRDCAWNLRGLYTLEPEPPERRTPTADRRRRLTVAPVIRRAG